MPSYPCSSQTALSVTATLDSLSIVPPNYRVKWRPAGIPGDYNTVIQSNNPVIISPVPKCYNIEGTIEAACADGTYGVARPFYIASSSAQCRTIKLLQTATYTYVPCGTDAPVNLTNNSLSPQTICVKDGTVTGGTFEDQNTACTG